MITLFSDIPTRQVKGEESLYCSTCREKTIHSYEEISFHASVLSVNLFCHKKRFVCICTACNNGTDLTEDEFHRHIRRIGGVKIQQDSKASPLPHQKSKQQGISYCNICGEKIYPDIGYCTVCAVRGGNPPKNSNKPAVLGDKAPGGSIKDPFTPPKYVKQGKKSSGKSPAKKAPGTPKTSKKAKPGSPENKGIPAVSSSTGKPLKGKPSKRPKKKTISVLDPYGVKRK